MTYVLTQENLLCHTDKVCYLLLLYCYYIVFTTFLYGLFWKYLFITLPNEVTSFYYSMRFQFNKIFFPYTLGICNHI